MTSGTTQDLHGVWGSSGSDVFAVGEWHHPPLRRQHLVCYGKSVRAEHLLSVWGRIERGSEVFAVGMAVPYSLRP